MSVVSLKIGGKEYQLVCDDGQEEHLRLLAEEVDERVSALIFGMKTHPGEVMAFLLTSLTMADELSDNAIKIDNINKELEMCRAQFEAHNADPQAMHNIEMETAMAETLDEIASRIEKIADHIEIR